MKTGKICVTITYKFGYINISSSQNEYVICGRTDENSYKKIKKEEKITIDNKQHKAEGVEIVGPGETLNLHNEFFVIILFDGTKIEYGSIIDDKATYNDYLKVKSDLIKIIDPTDNWLPMFKKFLNY